MKFPFMRIPTWFTHILFITKFTFIRLFTSWIVCIFFCRVNWLLSCDTICFLIFNTWRYLWILTKLCVRVWTTKLHLAANPFLQNSHWNGLSSRCNRWWSVKLMVHKNIKKCKWFWFLNVVFHKRNLVWFNRFYVILEQTRSNWLNCCSY